MQEWEIIRRRVLIEGASRRAVAREFNLHHSTLRKILANAAPPGYQKQAPRAAPKLDPHRDWIKAVLQADLHAPKKQQHTARRLYLRLKHERGYTGGETIVRDYVHELRRVTREVFVPLAQPPGEAQVDFFEAVVKYRATGKLAKVHVFAMHLPFSDRFFLKAYERECSEVFWDGHVSAFDFFRGVPSRISYDNLKIAVAKILGRHARELTAGFLELRSHYLFDSHFCNVRRGNEKGLVEGLAKYARVNFMVPVPEIADLEDLNQRLFESAWNDGHRRLRGKEQTKHALFAEEKLRPLPAAPFEACRKQAARASSLSLVRFDDNDYSVPVCCAHHALTVKGFVDTVRIFSGPEEVACHPRRWTRGGMYCEGFHYLPLLADKPGALDFGVPFATLRLPEVFADLRRRLEAEDAEHHAGSREYVRVLLLLSKHPESLVAAGITRALAVCPRPTVEVVRSFMYEDEHPEAATFRLEGRPHLAGVRVSGPDLTQYHSLVSKEDQV